MDQFKLLRATPIAVFGEKRTELTCAVFERIGS